jgi:Concanavalin A-like lectin/glucanases superfamily/Calx-beta domain
MKIRKSFRPVLAHTWTWGVLLFLICAITSRGWAELINVDFGGGPGPTPKVGFAATGETASDFWNYFNQSYGGGSGSLANLKRADGTVTSVGIAVQNAPGGWGSGSTDPMYNDFIYAFFGGSTTVTLTGLPVGSYDLYLYCGDGKYQVSSGGINYGTRIARESPIVNPPNWQEGVQYARFRRVTINTPGQSVVIVVLPGQDGLAVISGLQIASIRLVDVDFAGGPGPSGKSGFAAVGQTPNDFWNYFNQSYSVGSGSLNNLKLVGGTPSPVGISVVNAPGGWSSGSSDPMYNDYLYPYYGQGDMTTMLTGVPVGLYDLYLYSADGNFAVSAGAVNYGTKISRESPLVNPAAWEEGLQYVRYQNLLISAAGQNIVITGHPGLDGYAILSGLQLLQVAPTTCLAPPSGLVGWWRAENGATDSAGGHNGTLQNGTTYANAMVGTGFRFHGIYDGVRVPYAVNLINSAFSIEAWVKPLAQLDPGDQQCIFVQDHGELQLSIRPDPMGPGSRVAFRVTDNSAAGFTEVQSSREIPFGVFSHLAATWDGTALRIYIDGLLDVAQVTPNVPVASSTDFFIGAVNSIGGPYALYGIVDELSVYNRALTASEIQSIFDAESDGKCPQTVSVVATDPSASEVGPDSGTFTISRSGADLSASLTVRFDISGDASPGADYLSIDTQVVIPAGQNSAPLVVTPIPDALVEGTETVTLNLQKDVNYAVGSPASATVSILDMPVVSVQATDPNAGEPSDTGQYTISRTGSTSDPLVVYFTMGGTAVNGADYTTLSGPVNIPAGSPTTTINLAPIDNAAINGPRTAILTLSDNAAYTVGTRTATVTIADNEKATVSVSVADAIVMENGTLSGHVTLMRNGLTGYALPVYFTLSGAVNGVDFAPVTSPVTIPVGSSSAVIAITPIDNAAVNPARNVLLTLTADPGYIIDAANPDGVVQILDDELPSVTVVATDPTAAEPANPGTFTLSRSQNLSDPISVFYALSGTGKNGRDYQTLSGQVDFAASQSTATVQIQPIDNTHYEGTRDVTLTILPSVDYVDGNPGSATVLLNDDELPAIRVFAPVDQAIEGGTPGAFKLSRDGSTLSTLAVSFTLSGAVNGTDYQTIPTTATFQAGESEVTLNVVPVNDTIPKGSRDVQLTLSANPGYTIITGMGTAHVKIVDNDLPTVTVSAIDPNASEAGLDKGTFRFSRTSTSTSEAIQVNYAVTGTAVNLVDFNWLNGQVTIPAGQVSVDVDVVPIDDTDTEPTETVVARILASQDYVIGTANQATVNIADNEPTVYSFEVSRPTAVSSVTGGAPLQTGLPGEFVIHRLGSAPQTTVQITASGGTPGYTHRLDLSGNTLTFVEPNGASSSLSVNVNFPALANELRFSAGKRITGTMGMQSPLVNANVFFTAPAILGGQTAIINFLAPSHVFTMTKLGSQVAEGSSANLIRISRSVAAAPGDTFFVGLTVSGTATPAGVTGADHSLSATSQLQFNPSDLSKDISVQALADAQTTEGWETIDFAFDISNGAIVPDYTGGKRTTAEVFIRDSSLPVNAAPPVDTDKDGLLDSFETANGFDPNTPNDPNTDTDHDGASDLDEQADGTNPHNADSNSNGIIDGLESLRIVGLAPTPDTTPVVFSIGDISGSLSEQWQLRVGNAALTMPGHGGVISKTFYLQKGGNYPITLVHLSGINDFDWHASIDPPPGMQPEFLISDPQNLLGDHNDDPSFPGKTATITIPKVQLTWETKGDNVPIDDNPNRGGGKRIYVGAKSPSESSSRRNTIMLHVKTTPPQAGKTINLKSFDVDDATDPGTDVESRAGFPPGTHVIDTNGDAGNDNNPDAQSNPKPGFFVASGLSTYNPTLDGNGEILVEFQVGLQPGNNYRVAGAVVPGISQLQVDSPTANYFVPATGDAIAGGFGGGLSPMLTVWRKLNLEFDSMSAASQSPRVGTVSSVSQNVAKNQSAIIMSVVPPVPTEALLVNGTLTSGGLGYHIIANHVRSSGRVVQCIVTVQGLVPLTTPSGSLCNFTDDDDELLSDAGLPAPLPKLGETGRIITMLQPLFTPAYITPVDANAAGWNTHPNLPFILNEPVFSGIFSSFDDAADLSDSPTFWLHLASFGYQADAPQDGDPDLESALLGGTPKGLIFDARFSAIYVEAVRDDWAGPNRTFIRPGPFQNIPKAVNNYWKKIAGTVAHETGHAPGGNGGDTDHAESGMMQDGNIDLESYSSPTISRFRKAQSWSP